MSDLSDYKRMVVAPLQQKYLDRVNELKAEVAALRAARGTLLDALKLAYPYVRDAWEFEDAPACKEIAADDCRTIAKALQRVRSHTGKDPA